MKQMLPVRVSTMKDADSTWVVQKYGGTSLGKLLDTITGTIIPNSLKNDKVAVVCSARSSTSKSMGTTKLLLEAITFATEDSIDSGERVNSVISHIRDEHLDAVKFEIGDRGSTSETRLCQSLEESIVKDCERIRTFLHAAQVSRIPCLLFPREPKKKLIKCPPY